MVASIYAHTKGVYLLRRKKILFRLCYGYG
jgi:hypothetical protein